MATKNLAEFLRRKLKANPELAAAVARERFRANIGEQIYTLRIEAGLTQSELATLAGMHQSAIARIEDADYDAHSLKTLERIAAALGKRLEIRFVDDGLVDPQK
jgi:DNA-binding XRE family transcriptional regulator